MYMRKFLYILIVFFVLFLTQLQNSFAASDNVTEKLLKNGMKVIVKEDHRAPVVVSQIWYKVGSSYESDGNTGVSHALEHMMFKGSSKYPDDSFNKIIAANGAEDNAFTSRDYTAYYQILEKSRLNVSFKLESDRMRNLILRNKDFEQEIKVVQEERRWRTEDKPKALVDEQLYVTAFDNSGYHHPVIGWMDDLKNMNIKDLKKWYQTYYSPNNAILVVIGDINTDEVFKMAENYFAEIPPSKNIPDNQRKERNQRSSKLVKLMIPAKVAYLSMGFKVPVINTAQQLWEPYALQLLAGILDGGDSTRLNRNLIKGKQIASSAGASYSLGERMDTLFELDAIPASGKNMQDLQQSVMNELQKLKDKAVTVAELDRVKNQIIASSVYEKDSIFYQALKIGLSEANGVGWKVEQTFVDQIKRVTPEQIQQVAQKYLVDQRKTVAILEPQSTNDT